MIVTGTQTFRTAGNKPQVALQNPSLTELRQEREAWKHNPDKLREIDSRIKELQGQVRGA